MASEAFESRYEVQGRLWADGPHGGFLALDRFMGREVVVNIPYRPAHNESFLRRARLWARLRHTNLIPVYDLGVTSDERPFYIVPHVRGLHLGRMFDECAHDASAVTFLRLVGCLLDACKAIAFLHANQRLHLELHPCNVLVSPQSNEVFLIRELAECPPFADCSEAEAKRDTGGVMGVIRYMAPEQVDSRTLGAPDVCTDVYGIGGVLFKLLYANPPNGEGSVGGILTDLMARRGPPNPGTLSAQAARYRALAKKLELVCLRALEVDRTKRHASVAAFVSEIEHAVWGYAG
jgi:serine/threonine protein kinase